MLIIDIPGHGPTQHNIFWPALHFELMIRNTWRISGGEGWCANTANKRVLEPQYGHNRFGLLRKPRHHRTAPGQPETME